MRTPSERFAAMDKNRDGKITREEFVEPSPWFDRLQKNGVVTKADFAALLDGKENVQP